MTQDDINLVDSHIDQRIQAERERNEGHFMTVENCQVEMNRNDEKILDLHKEIAEIKQDVADLRVEESKSGTKLSVLIAILSAIGVAVLSVCAEFLFR